jgi:hypothetical protein
MGKDGGRHGKQGRWTGGIRTKERKEGRRRQCSTITDEWICKEGRTEGRRRKEKNISQK